MNNKLKVILASNNGLFEPNKEFQELLDKKELSWYDLKARTDSEIIDFVEDNKYGRYSISQVGKEKYQYVSISEVDINKPWTIRDYDGSEYIQYIEYDVIDEVLNYCEFK